MSWKTLNVIPRKTDNSATIDSLFSDGKIYFRFRAVATLNDEGRKSYAIEADKALEKHIKSRETLSQEDLETLGKEMNGQPFAIDVINKRKVDDEKLAVEKENAKKALIEKQAQDDLDNQGKTDKPEGPKDDKPEDDDSDDEKKGPDGNEQPGPGDETTEEDTRSDKEKHQAQLIEEQRVIDEKTAEEDKANKDRLEAEAKREKEINDAKHQKHGKDGKFTKK